MTKLDPRFRGNVPALVTPCVDGERPDLAGLGRLVDFVIAGGVDAFNVLGTTWEFSLVPPRHRRAVIETAVSAAAGRVPVMVGCGRPSFSETMAEIEEAAAAGAVAALVTPSYYFTLSEPEITRFFAALAEKATIPLLYYHIPQLTKAQTNPSIVATLAKNGVIAGAKDSGGDAAFFSRLLAETREIADFRSFIGGSAYLLAALAHGASGVTGALSNFAPHLDRALLDAFAKRDLAAARKAQAEIVRANEVIFLSMRRNPAAVTKSVLARLGVCRPIMFEPLAPLSTHEALEISARLSSFDVAVRA